MNFFKSILSDDADPPNRDPDPNADESHTPTNKTDGDAGNSWSFGDLMKTLANQSESMLDTYRKDLREFGTGLKKETEILSRAVKDLPVSLEAAQGAIDGVIKSTAEIISKEASIFVSDGESSDTAEIKRTSSNSGRYSWYESQMSAIQSDASTFTEDPEDAEEYNKWKLGFELGEAYRAEIEVLIAENSAVEAFYERIVPDKVDEETFWCRYFFRADRLKQQERMREKLMKRVSVDDDDDEELSWDVDDDDEDDDGGHKVENKKEKGSGEIEKERDDSRLDEAGISSDVQKQEHSKNDDKEKESVSELSEDLDKIEPKVEEVAEAKSEEQVKSQVIAEEEKDNEVDRREVREKDQKNDEVVVSNPKEDDEDMGWDEIEDVESGDERKTSDAAKVSAESGSSNREELRKRLSVSAENDGEDEDLNWDIEDDDGDDVPAKA